MHVTVNVSALDEIRDRLNAMGDSFDDFTLPLQKGADLILGDVLSAFETGGASVGESWRPLAATTFLRWGRHEFGRGPTGNLIGSIRKFVRPFLVGVEATAPHARLFESGTKEVARIPTAGGTLRISARRPRPRVTMFMGEERQPARPFLILTERTQRGIIEICLDYVMREAA
jgi:hypothetical protein